MSVTDDPDAWIRFHICETPHWSGVTRLGVAVSGGGDSMALLHVLAECAPAAGVVLEAATVDHGLRPGSAAEADFVKRACEALDCQHETLVWEGWDGRGNLQAEARAARYRLLAGWARRRGLDLVALGHTMDDQAETFVMRLAREAGVDGLAAMEAVFARDGAAFWRPALALRRGQLRGYLARRGLDWREDPSNEDESFDRVKARRALAALSPLGIDAGTLAAVAVNLSSAREVLAATTRDAAARIARVQSGDVVLDRDGLLDQPWEIQRRLVAAALAWVATADYGPRRDAVSDLGVAILRRETRTLHGCLITCDDNTVRIAREYKAVRHLTAAPGALWDNRWRVTGPVEEAGVIRALGEGVNLCPDWRNTGLPRSSLMASPAVWRGETLIAAPIAGLSGGFSAEIAHPRGDFGPSIQTH
ncbi:MAG: tRNA lysidine(34) synthetase TilS [Paracoccaceae bacterium]